MAGKKIEGQAHGKKFFDVTVSFREDTKFGDWARFMENELSAASSIEILSIKHFGYDIELELRILEKD